MSEIFATPINAATRYCAVFGYPVKHSASPAMQNAGLSHLGLNWRYLAFEVHPQNLREAILGAQRMQFVGLNLTLPHKLLAVTMVDHLNDSARIWGAVNTIRFEAKDGRGEWQPLHSFSEPITGDIRAQGFNTDADAIAQSLREDLGLKLAGTKILLLGAGGAGRAAALKLASEKVSELFLVNRTLSKAESLAVEIRSRFPQVKVAVGYSRQTFDLVLNATSLGLNPNDDLPFDRTQFSFQQARAAYEMTYQPVETAFLAAARKSGCRTANGLGMLLYQGAEALELWTGRTAPIEIMRNALMKNVYE